MIQTNVVEISRYRKDRKKKKVGRLIAGKKGRVFSRGGRLWVGFQYLKRRVREPSGLEDSPQNKASLRSQLDLVVAEIEARHFEFAKRFPHSKRKDHFTALEGRTVTKDPKDLLFGEYLKKWWADMEPGMTFSQKRDYQITLRAHVLPYFEEMAFSEICSRVEMKRFVSTLQAKKNRYGQPLSARRVRNVMIPLRVIVRDALEEYSWSGLQDPFIRLKLPKIRKFRVQPFSLEEWKVIMQFMLPWYIPYFQIAVQTGMRPSEQVALKWQAVDDEYIHVELSRVYGREKADLKTEESRRRIQIRPGIQKWLDEQRELTKEFNSPYVFTNTEGRPILQDKLREVWARVITKSGVRYRRMYEVRHTFASWALAAGEIPEWVARTLGHVDTTMVYRVYGRYIPNLTRQDGSAFERLYTGD
jgi:integrase